jgi:transglutaminase/protease-like cytokinesis protein 3
VHIAYDVASLDPSQRKAQDADATYTRRTGVCAGYSNLMVALGTAAGLEIIYVRGYSRDFDNHVDPAGHAWNAARVDGQWLLLDATWDAGWVGDNQFHARYSSKYLFIPPNVMGLDHLPDHPGRFGSEPSTQAFLERPRFEPVEFADHLRLVSPTVTHTLAGDSAIVTLENPWQLRLEVQAGATDCILSSEGEHLTATCPIASTPATVEIYAINDTRPRSLVGHLVIDVPE